MKGFKRITCLALMFALTCTLAGCGGDDNGGGTAGADAAGTAVEASESISMADLKAKVEKMSDSDLVASARKYKEAILSKQAELDKIVGQLATKLLSNKENEPGPDMTTLNASIQALSERFTIIVDKLKEKGLDVSEFTG